MKRYFNKKLSYQVVFAITVCSILMSLIGGIILIHNSTLYLSREVRSKYAYVVNDYAHRIAVQILEAEALVRDINSHSEIQWDQNLVDLNDKVIHNKGLQMDLQDIKDEDENIYDLFVYIKSNENSEGMLVTSHTEISNAEHDEIITLISDMSLDLGDAKGDWENYNDKNLLSFVQPMIIDDKVVGFAGGRFRTFSFLKEASAVTNSLKSDLIFYDQEDNYIVLSHGLAGKLSVEIQPIRSVAEEGIFEYKDPEKRTIFVSLSEMPNGWSMVVKMSKQDVMAQSYELLNMMVMLTLIGMVFSIFIALSISNRITEPISELTQEVTRIGKGNYETPVPETYLAYGNEIGVLATHVESMRLSISEYIEDVEENSKSLEHLVEERTSQLIETNTYLEQSLAELEEKEAELVLLNDELEQTLENLRGTQENLIESRKLSALSGLVKGVAHQLNTPIGISVTSVSFLEQELNGLTNLLKSNGFVNNPVNESLANVAEVTHMVTKSLNKARDILDTFKYITADSSNEKPVQLELCEFFGELTDAIMAKSEYSKYTLNFKCEKEVVIQSYPIVLTQILSHLISNSVIHGFRNRESGEIEIELYENDHNVIMEYRDNGHGISENHIEQIFDPFFTSQMGNKHLGLGLSIVYNYVVVKMLGSIRSESVHGDGTHFKIQFPK